QPARPAPKRKLAPRVLGSQPFECQLRRPALRGEVRCAQCCQHLASFAILAQKTSAQLVWERKRCNWPGFLRNCVAVADRRACSAPKSTLAARLRTLSAPGSMLLFRPARSLASSGCGAGMLLLGDVAWRQSQSWSCSSAVLAMLAGSPAP